jgi:XTP/dITP diphosphohydrolase
MPAKCRGRWRKSGKSLVSKALSEGNQVQIEKEFGDLLFSLVNLARFIHVHPEEALRKTIDKFVRRFQYIEKGLEREGKAFNNVSLAEMDTLWEEAKDVLEE